MRLSFLWARFLPEAFILNSARLGPIGLARYGPGTWGSLAGCLFYTAFIYPGTFFWNTIFMLSLTYFATAMCEEAEFRLGRKDPGEVIIDEFAAIPFCFIGLREQMHPGNMWVYILAGFLLFRFFDILKPLGIKRLQSLKGGIGVMLDDLAAALATCICLHLGNAFLF